MHSDVKFEDYEKDTRELAERAAAIIVGLRSQLREREVLMWAMVRAAGGSILVRNYDLALGDPEAWSIEEDVAQNGRLFTIKRKVL
jgi:hypothetical protein